MSLSWKWSYSRTKHLDPEKLGGAEEEVKERREEGVGKKRREQKKD